MSAGGNKTRGKTTKVKPPASQNGDRIALVAGGGTIPVMVAKSLSEAGKSPFIAMLEGDADPALSIFEHMHMSSALIGKLIAELKKRQITQLVLVGTVQARPKWSDFRPDLTTLKLLTRIISGLKSGDNALLSNVVNAIEEAGIKVVGVHEILPELLAINGVISGSKPTKTMLDSIRVGADAATRLGALDAGQGVVVIGRRIVALEGAEGTDQMLLRVADLRKTGKLPQKAGGVLVKLCKPQQDRRIDMPTIGVRTVQNAAAAGLKGIAIHAGSTLINNIDEVCALADQHNMFIFGHQPEQSGHS